MSLSRPSAGERQGILGGPSPSASRTMFSPTDEGLLRADAIFQPVQGVSAGSLRTVADEGIATPELAVAFSASSVGAESPSGASPVVAGDESKPIPGYFIMPTQGFNWGRLHNHNAVDIANACGTRVVAAADGLVVPDPNFGDGTSGWNGGYGLFVFLEHPNGTKTRYAHLSKILVSIGGYVKQGSVIGFMGETGEATGCHVHFEVYGAENPFAKS